MAAKPYVGITGPVNIQETMDICNEFYEAGYTMKTPHIPMLGFLVSYKTLNGQGTKNRRYPPINELPELLQAVNGKALTMIHYNSREMNSLSDQIFKLFDDIYEENLCRSLQLNIVWPDIEQITKIKENYPKMNIVFQLSHKATEGKIPREISEGVKYYGDLLDYVLIDPSGGRGMPFHLKSSIEIYKELRKQCPGLTIGFAGGFDGENVAPRLKELVQHTEETNFCIDAEGGLRDKITSEYGDDVLNIEKARKYLQNASSVLE